MARTADEGHISVPFPTNTNQPCFKARASRSGWVHKVSVSGKTQDGWSFHHSSRTQRRPCILGVPSLEVYQWILLHMLEPKELKCSILTLHDTRVWVQVSIISDICELLGAAESKALPLSLNLPFYKVPWQLVCLLNIENHGTRRF